MKSLHKFVTVLLGIGISCNVQASFNLLMDPGFESGRTVTSGTTGGWFPIFTAGFSTEFAHSGNWSMKCSADPFNYQSAETQFLPASAGTEYSLSGWAMTPTGLDASVAALVMIFTDADRHLIGNIIDSPGKITFQSDLNIWIPLSITAAAPDGTAFVYVQTLLWNGNMDAEGTAVFFDDLVLVPEPSGFCLLAAGCGVSILARRRKVETLP